VGPPPPTFWHTCQGEQPTGGQIQLWLAAWLGTGMPYLGTCSPSMAVPPPHLRIGYLPLGVAVLQPSPGHTHWEAVKQPFHYSPDTPNPHFAHAEVISLQKGLSKCDGSNAMDQHAILGHASPITESGHTAVTHSGKEVSWPHSPTSHTLQWSLQPPCVTTPSITTQATQVANAFTKALPSSTSPQPLAYVRSEGECCKIRDQALGPRTPLP